MDSTLFWTGWTPIVHCLVIATVGYLVLVLLLRTTGPRTLSAMTPLDVVIAISLGSVFGRTVTASEVPVAEAVTALVALVGLKWLLASARARFPAVRSLLDHPAELLYEDGHVNRHALRRHRLVEADLHEAARAHGLGSLEQVEAIVLLRAGGMGVVTRAQAGDGSSLTRASGCRQG